MGQKDKHLLSTLSKIQLLQLLKDKEKAVEEAKVENAVLRISLATWLGKHYEIFPLKKIIALMPGNVFWKSKEGKYLGCNNNLAAFQNFESPDEIVGKYNKDFMPADQALKLDQIDEAVMASKESIAIEERGRDKTGNLAIFFTEKTPLYNDDAEVIGLLGISMNITERKKMEQELKIAKEKAEASNLAKSQFLALVNHELRTPLTSIIGMLEFLKQEENLTSEAKRLIATMNNSSQYLLSLVTDILDFSRLESDKFTIKYSIVKLHDLLQEVYNITSPLAKNKQFDLYMQMPICKIIEADVRVLRHILINLIGNAIKFTEKGFVEIEIEETPIDEKEVILTFIIKDTGIGMSEDTLEVIFEPFKQLEEPYTRHSSRSGTGLGLAIVKRLTEAIGGKITVKSTLGVGSTFTVSAKFLKVSALQAENKLLSVKTFSDKTPVYPHYFSTPPRVLLVEDDEFVQYMHKRMLTELGCVVSAVMRGREAMENLPDQDILFVDLSLPDMSGFELIKLIRSSPNYGYLPIVALTAYTGKEEETASLMAGANSFTTKPISSAHLREVLVSMLQK